MLNKMLKSISMNYILNRNVKNLFFKSFRLSSSNHFENIPIFKSDLSLDRLYHKSDSVHNIETMSSTPDHFNGEIPIKKLDISYSRSGGPGGQHVNTTNTKVTVKFHLESADWIPLQTRQRLLDLHKNSVNKEGFWIIRSDKTREQIINLGDCMDKIRCYITEASKPLYKPSIESLEKIKENREKAAIRRLETKKQRSFLKSDRRSMD